MRKLASLITLLFIAASPLAVQAALTEIAADNPAFAYQGRIDFAEPNAPVMIWQGSTASIAFEGKKLVLHFDGVKDQAFFNLEIDGETTLVRAENGSIPYSGKLSDGWHTLRLFKRSEATAGIAAFEGISIQKKASVKAADEPEYDHTFLFFGDSITSGACNEDGESDQWEDRSTHNHQMSYAPLAADMLNAQFRTISVSGIGVAQGYVPFTFPQIWNKLYPDPQSDFADLDAFVPDYLFINLGENDSSIAARANEPFPDAYSSGYLELIAEIRAAYPDTRIVILRGGMYGGARNPELRKAWEFVVETAEKSDPNIAHFVFEHWSPQHPRVADDKIMAEELANWLREDLAKN